MKRTISDGSTRASLAPAGSTHRGNVEESPHGGAGFREKSLVLDAAVDEYLRLRREGASVNADEFCERYPDYRNSLRRLIDVEEELSRVDAEQRNPWPEVGGMFLGYGVLELLGSGSTARVFLAAEFKLGGRPVAIKVSRHGGYEAETLGKLRHPNIVEVYSVNHDDETGLTAVCMPYQGSATLSDVLDAAYRTRQLPEKASIILDVARRMALTQALPQDESTRAVGHRILERGTFVDGVVHVGVQLAAALQYAHSRGVLHRDLKPSNVLLTPQGRPMLLDFNLSFDEALNVVRPGGTLPYSAPEQLREAIADRAGGQSTVDVRADVFSLGAILYQLLTGQLPFGAPPADVGPLHAIQMQLDAHHIPPPPVSSLNKQVDAQLAAVVQRCLEVEPARRFASMSELEAALKRHFQIRRRVRRWVQLYPARACTALASVVVLLAAIGVYAATLPPYPERMHQAGLVALKQGNDRQAIRYLDKAIDAKPDNGYGLFLRGLAHYRLDDYQRAVADFQLALKQGYESEAVAEYCGYSQFKLQQPMAAFYSYSRASRIDPSASHLYLNRAYLLFEANPSMVPTPDLAKAISLDPNSFEGYLLRACFAFRVARNERRRFDESVADIQKACELSKSLPLLEFQAAEILAAASAYRPELELEARTHLARAVDLGWSRTSIQESTAFVAWKNKPWFQELLDACKSHTKNPLPTLPDLIMTQPKPVQLN